MTVDVFRKAGKNSQGRRDPEPKVNGGATRRAVAESLTHLYNGRDRRGRVVPRRGNTTVSKLKPFAWHVNFTTPKREHSSRFRAQNSVRRVRSIEALRMGQIERIP